MIMPFALTYAELKALKPCEDDFVKVIAILGGAAAWGGRLVTATDARAAGVSMDHVVWVASRLALSNGEIARRLQHWSCDCAMRVLAIFEDRVPGDGRPRAAIEAGRRYADGLIGAAEWAAARAAAEDAASDAAQAAAWDAAWGAAGAAASSAAWSPAGAAGWNTAAWGAAWDAARIAAEAAAEAAADDAAWDAARIAAEAAAEAAASAASSAAAWAAAEAAALDAALDAGWNTAEWAAARDAAARGAEQDWQFTRLCEWMSDTPPDAEPGLLAASKSSPTLTDTGA